MNILLVDHYAGSPAHGMEFRPFFMAKEWERLGHSVRIVAASFTHLRYKQPEVTDLITHEWIDDVHYIWLKTPLYQGNGLGRVRNISSFLYLLKKNEDPILAGFTPDAIIASSTYPFDNYIVRSFARKHNAAHVFELHDLWPLSLIELGGMPNWHPFVVLTGLAERYTCRTADRVVSLLPNAERHLLTKGLPKGRFKWIPNGAQAHSREDADGVLPCPHSEALKRVKAQRHFVLGYVGGHSISNALDNLLRAARVINHEEVSVLLVGDGAEKERLRALASQWGLHNVHFLPPVPKNIVPLLLSNFDVLYLGWQRRPIYRYGVSPNKLIDYMCAAKPIIHATESANDLVAESGCGISIPPDDPQSLAQTIRSFLTMPRTEIVAMGEKGREYVLKNLGLEQLAREYLEFISE
jgi:glycosyltransferase involved in cell wall biosynthesis